MQITDTSILGLGRLLGQKWDPAATRVHVFVALLRSEALTSENKNMPALTMVREEQGGVSGGSNQITSSKYESCT